MPRLTAVPALRSQRRSLRFKQRVVFALLGFAAVSGPLSLFVSLRAPDPATVAQAIVQSNTPFTATARFLIVEAYSRQIAEDYLSGRGTTLPVAATEQAVVDKTFGQPNPSVAAPLSYSGLSLVGAVPGFIDSRPSYEMIYSLKPLGKDGTPGSLMLLFVKLRTDTNGNLVLAAVPSLVDGRLAGLESGFGNQVVIDQPQNLGAPSSLSASASDALNKWAALYVSDNRAELKNHVNSDSGKPDRTYQGLPGNFTLLGNPIVLYVFETTPPNSTKAHYMARIQLPLSKDGFQVLSEMDVLILKEDPAYVRAWGPVGSGSGGSFVTLEPWSNGIDP